MKEWIWGKNPVYEVLRAGRRKAYQLRIAEGLQTGGRLGEILRLAKDSSIPVSRVPREMLQGINSHNQGIVVQVDAFKYIDLKSSLEEARKLNETPLILLLDTLKDRQVFVSVRGDSIRVTPHLYNDDEDVERFFAALEAALS